MCHGEAGHCGSGSWRGRKEQKVSLRLQDEQEVAGKGRLQAERTFRQGLVLKEEHGEGCGQ